MQGSQHLRAGSVLQWPSSRAVPRSITDHGQRFLDMRTPSHADDPALVQQVSETTLYRHAARSIKWAIFVLRFSI
jgi:hypothetical protein